jgi:hypothetical protein
MVTWLRQTTTYHPWIGWWFVPNLKALTPAMYHSHASPGWQWWFIPKPLKSYATDYFVVTNSIGMRSDREYLAHQSDSRHRIILLGDSYTAGSFVKNGDRFSDLLEQSNPNLDVMNFGLPGSGTDQQLLVYESIARGFEADAYIFAPCTTNIMRNMSGLFLFTPRGTENARYRAKPYFTIEEGELTLHNQPVPKTLLTPEEAFERLGTSGVLGIFNMGVSPLRYMIKDFLPKWMQGNSLVGRISHSLGPPFKVYESEKSRPWQVMRAIIERFVKQVNGKPVFIVPLPTDYHYMTDIHPRYMERFFEIEKAYDNCYVIDLLPWFKRMPLDERRECGFFNDIHYSPLGHRVVANALVDSISKHCPELLS